MLECDWCTKPISGAKAKGWGSQVELTHSTRSRLA
jgi:hypothetical protein